MAPQGENGIAYLRERMEILEEAAKDEKELMRVGFQSVVEAVNGLSINVGNKMEGMNDKLDLVIANHKDLVRWLLWVVCIIALGNRAPEIIAAIIKAFRG